MRRTKLILMATVLLASCATLPPQYKNSPSKVDLDPRASSVRLVEFLPSTEREQYDEIKLVSCAIGFNARQVETNMQSCENLFRNQALAAGASLVLVKPESKHIGQTMLVSQLDGTNMVCANCVEMQGVLMKARSRAKRAR